MCFLFSHLTAKNQFLTIAIVILRHCLVQQFFKKWFQRHFSWKPDVMENKFHFQCVKCLRKDLEPSYLQNPCRAVKLMTNAVRSLIKQFSAVFRQKFGEEVTEKIFVHITIRRRCLSWVVAIRDITSNKSIHYLLDYGGCKTLFNET